MSDKDLIDKPKLEKIESLKSIKKDFQNFFNDIIEEWKVSGAWSCQGKQREQTSSYHEMRTRLLLNC